MITIRVRGPLTNTYFIYVDDGESLFQVVNLLEDCQYVTGYTVLANWEEFVEPHHYGFGMFQKWATKLFPIPEFVSEKVPTHLIPKQE